MEEYTEESIFCYRKYLELSGYPGEVIEIPYEDTVWVNDEAQKRGTHCIVVEGPGQGAVLRLKKIPFRKDWEKVVSPIVDYVAKVPCVDMDRIVLMGLSFGGYLVSRAAAFEKRIKLCIANPGNISWGKSNIDNINIIVRNRQIPIYREAKI